MTMWRKIVARWCQSQIDKLTRKQKNRLEILERGSCIRQRKNLGLMVRAERTEIKVGCTHPARQLDRVRIAIVCSTRNGPMYLGSSLLLPTLVTTCFGRFTVDSRTKSPTLIRRRFALPCLSAFRFCRSTALAMESCTKRTISSRDSRKSSAESLWFVAVRLVRTARRSSSFSARVFSSSLV